MRSVSFDLRSSRRAVATALALAALAGGPRGAAGQRPAGDAGHAGHGAPAADTARRDGAADAVPDVRWAVGAQAVGLVTRASPAYDGRALTEAYLTQPIVFGHLALPRRGVTLAGMLDLEGLTLRRGELNAGIYGEGYVDRRHPHTFVHEAVATLAPGGAPLAWSLTAGKGFVPFGSDDPMVRPFAKYPVNHHLAQILERLVAAAAVRVGPVIAEAGAFNGDEPTGPWAAPAFRRFGDSWGGRLTLLPLAGVELSASAATVRSPEYRPGDGVDHRKWHAGLRVARGTPGADGRYLLVEAARNDDRIRGRPSHRFHSALAEGALERDGWQLAARLERTDRPEEERLVDPFRTVPAAGDHVIIGVTRWEGATVALSRAVGGSGGRTALRPFVEVARLRATERVAGSLFQPAAFYGSAVQWSLSAGLRVRWGASHDRMGRYGVAAVGSSGAGAHDGPHGGAHEGAP